MRSSSIETLPFYTQQEDKRRSLEDVATPLPAGWMCLYDENSNHHYYVDMNCTPPQSSWLHPRHAPPPPPPSIIPRKGLFGKLKSKLQDLEAEAAQQDAKNREELLQRYAKRREQVLVGLAAESSTASGNEHIGPPASPYGGRYMGLMPPRVDNNMAGWLG
uniref:WW/Rsp5/WWP protein n=1 Tax=Mycena chlorophos TaxID=658473 RepID=A0ABQ0LZ07_MYCCL|nr:WW/Rsp5/WWP protein [Mycena chlorophos]